MTGVNAMTKTTRGLLMAAVTACAAAGWSAAADAGTEPEAAHGAATGVRPRSRRPLMARVFEKRFDRRLVRDKQRAVSIPLADYQLLPLRTGDSVDILATFDVKTEKKSEKLCATILQNVRVVGVSLSSAAEGKGAVVLALNPNEAQMAALSVEQSDLTVALRNDGDREVYPMEIAGYAKMFR